MKQLFESLLGIRDSGELKLTLAILTHAAGCEDHLCVVSYDELQSSTGLSRTTLSKSVKAMLARGYIARRLVSRNQPAQYQVVWHKLGMSINPDGSLNPQEKSSMSSLTPFSERLKSYFTNTGFLDMLPMAADIANQMRYQEPEMIEAICMLFDKQRHYPPTSNRSGWFATVYKEKLAEAHALIAHWRDKQE